MRGELLQVNTFLDYALHAHLSILRHGSTKSII